MENYTSDLPANSSEGRIITYAHVLGSIEKSNAHEIDKSIFEYIFYDLIENTRNYDISIPLRKLRSCLIKEFGIKSGLINICKGAKIW
jgi:hypothetical protein